jgi:hypothetical protein
MEDDENLKKTQALDLAAQKQDQISPTRNLTKQKTQLTNENLKSKVADDTYGRKNCCTK